VVVLTAALDSKALRTNLRDLLGSLDLPPQDPMRPRGVRIDLADRTLDVMELRRLFHVLRLEFDLPVAGLICSDACLRRYAERELKMRVFAPQPVERRPVERQSVERQPVEPQPVKPQSLPPQPVEPQSVTPQPISAPRDESPAESPAESAPVETPAETSAADAVAEASLEAPDREAPVDVDSPDHAESTAADHADTTAGADAELTAEINPEITTEINAELNTETDVETPETAGAEVTVEDPTPRSADLAAASDADQSQIVESSPIKSRPVETSADTPAGPRDIVTTLLDADLDDLEDMPTAPGTIALSRPEPKPQREQRDSGDEATGRRVKVIEKTLRSGTRVRFPGDVLVYGDVNAGAHIEAGGNIIVLGSLRGLAHAGASGDEKALVVSFDLRPTQIRIASLIACPEGQSPPERGPLSWVRWSRERTRASTPEVAHVRDGAIVLDNFSGRLPAGS